jgi:hypothetical protein
VADGFRAVFIRDLEESERYLEGVAACNGETEREVQLEEDLKESGRNEKLEKLSQQGFVEMFCLLQTSFLTAS